MTQIIRTKDSVPKKEENTKMRTEEVIFFDEFAIFIKNSARMIKLAIVEDFM